MKRGYGTMAVVLGVCIGAKAAWAQDGYRWGKETRGLQVAIRPDEPDRSVWHPGELMRFDVQIRTTRNILIPDEQMVEWVEEHLVTPDGREFVRNELRRYDENPTTWHVIDSWTRSTDTIGENRQVRLSGGDGWYAADTKKEADISLGKVGKYRLWMECDAVRGEYAPKNAWNGSAVSPEVDWEVAHLKPEEARMTMTGGQENDVEAWCVEGQEKNEQAHQRLISWVALAENEGLSRRLLEIGEKGGDAGDAALEILALRCGGPEGGNEGIDGPYLKTWTEWEMGMDDAGPDGAARAKATEFLGDERGITAGLVYLDYHPEDGAMRDRMIGLARKSARRGEAAEGKPGGAPARRLALPLAWEALLHLNVLKDGMTLADAQEILGPPTNDREGRMSWVLRPTAEASAAIGGELVDGKVTKWRMRR